MDALARHVLAGTVLHAAGQAPPAIEAVQRINALYGIERDLTGRPPDERARERQAQAGATPRAPSATPSHAGRR